MKKFLTVLLATSAFSSSVTAEVLKAVSIEGTNRIEDATIMNYLNLKKGQNATELELDNATKILFGTGLFSDVQIKVNDGIAYVKVVENPIVHNVYFEGNDKLDDNTLKSEIQLKPRMVWTKNKVQNDVRRLLDIYKRHGRYGAKIEPKIIKKDQNRVDVIYEIKEGDQSFIRKINFIGNKKFTGDELQEALISKEYAWYRFFASTDTYDPDRLNYDKEALRQFYLKKGYVDFKVNSAVAEMTPDKKDFIVSFDITEGPRYKFAEPKLQVSLPEYGDNLNKLKSLITFKAGQWFDAEQVEKTIGKLVDAFSEEGYAFADVQPVFDKNEVNKTIEVTFQASEGEKVFINRINISGNTRTLDKVIRRELRIKEGDAFNASRVRHSKQRVDNLGYFEKADFKNEPVSSNKTDIAIDVAEKSTGAFNIGVGWSSYDGMMFETGIRERNILGTGIIAGLNLMLSQTQAQYQFDLTDPYFLNKNLMAGLSLFHTTQDNKDYSSYKSKTTGGTVRFGWDYTDFLSHTVRYTLKKDNVYDIDSDASAYIKDQKGEYWVSMVGQELAYDKRDNRMNPTTGYYLSLATDYAGLGGDTKFFRVNLTGIKYYSVTEDVVFSVRGDWGRIWGIGGEKVRINNRFFLGDALLRGFEYAGVGAKAKDTRDSLGGLWYTSVSAELNFPVGLPREIGIKGKLFVDAGMLGKPDDFDPETMYYSDKVRVAVGTGFLWQSPLGMINLDFAFPVVKDRYDDKRIIRLNFGKGF